MGVRGRLREPWRLRSSVCLGSSAKDVCAWGQGREWDVQERWGTQPAGVKEASSKRETTASDGFLRPDFLSISKAGREYSVAES